METDLGAAAAPTPTDTSSPVSQPTSSSASAGNAKPLSCVSCRQRKVKCNKIHPCAPCQKSGLECVFRSRVRVPRGRQGVSKARDSELLKRIARLESLVSKVDKAQASKEEVAQNEEVEAFARPSTGPVNMDSSFQPHPIGVSTFAAFVQRQKNGTRYLSDDFWASLGEEVDGLRQLLEHPSEGESDSDIDESRSTGSKQGSSPGFIFGVYDGTELVGPYVSKVQQDVLYRVYFSRVHPIYRVLHQPCCMANLSSTSDPGLVDPHTQRYKFESLEALVCAVFFTAVLSMSPEECIEEFSEEKVIVEARFKRRTEQALADADFLNSMEITTLQALSIYVLALRTYSSSRSSWTLVSLVVRIAQSLGLHKDGDGRQYPAFEAEMRRRLWWFILVLDIRASEDRGAAPVIQEDSFNTRIPCNINDEEFSLGSMHPLPDKTGFTDMTFSLITMHVSNTVRSLNFIPSTNNRHNLTPQQKEDRVRQCTQRIERQFLDSIQPSELTPWVAATVGRLLILKLWTVVQYPLQSRPSASRSDFAGGQGSRTVIAYLELTEVIAESPHSKHFMWHFNTYIPWHPVAVALAEIINDPKGPLADRAWAVITRNYKKWGNLIADSKDGMLWRPVKKLYKRAQAARELSTEHELEQSIAKVVPTVNPVAGDPTQDLVSETSAMDLGDTSSNPILAPGFPGDNGPLPFGQAALPDYGFDWAQPLDIQVQPELSSDIYGGPVNWDDWNEFILGVGEVGSSAQPNTYEEWQMLMQMQM